MKKLIYVLCLAFAANIQAQPMMTLDSSIHVFENGNQLSKAWTGGLDCPMYSVIDLNNDGVKDLFVYDHKVRRISTFINNNQSGVSYRYAPEYAELFPPIIDWVKLYDFDCDGFEDVFTHNNGHIACYRNNGTFPLSFSWVTSSIQSWFKLSASVNFQTNVFVTPINVPSFVDIDNDGDMDILNSANGAGHIEYQKNYSMDSTGLCGGFRFYNIRLCWGYFTLSGSNNIANLPPATIVDCPLYPATQPRSANPNAAMDSTRHGGTVLAAIDIEGDGDKDLFVGDIVSKTLLLINNGGTQDSAYAISQDTLFPQYDIPASMETIAAPYIEDVNNDGKKDLLVSNFNADIIQGAGENYYNTLYYENISPGAGHVFQYVKNSFLTEEMIDVGTGAHPVFIDVDKDGKEDLIVGSEYVYYTGGDRKGQLSYYRNTGTTLVPQYDLVTHDFAALSTQSFEGTAPTFGDIDHDGDEDMILGTDSGSIILYRNIAGAGNPLFFMLDSVNYQNINVGVGSQSLPQLFDLDKDGLLDLIIGRRPGDLYYYKNTGTSANPVFTLINNSLGNVDVHNPNFLLGFSAPLFYRVSGVTQLLVGCYDGNIYHYTNIDGNLSGTFTLADSLYMKIFEPSNSSPAMTDLNGDGLFDLVVGNLAGGLRCYIQSVVSVSELTPDPGFRYYPNPANSHVTIEMNSPGHQLRSLSIVDVLGNVVVKSMIDRKQEVDLTGLMPGSYVIVVEDRGKSVSQKLVVR